MSATLISKNIGKELEKIVDENRGKNGKMTRLVLGLLA